MGLLSKKSHTRGIRCLQHINNHTFPLQATMSGMKQLEEPPTTKKFKLTKILKSKNSKSDITKRYSREGSAILMLCRYN